MEKIATKADIGNYTWEAESLRLTIFIPVSTQISGEQGWWEALIGIAPDSQETKPKSGQHRSIGNVLCKEKSLSLELSTQPDRIDWVLSPTKLDKDSISNLDSMPNMGPFQELLDFFHGLMRKWMEDYCPNVQRIAFGAVLFQVVENRETGYRRIDLYLPSVQIDPEGSFDFSYTINRPRESRVIKDIRMNRLSKWSVAQFYKVFVSQGAGITPRERRMNLNSACRLELDISSDVHYEGELPSGSILELYDELLSLGQEIALEGDIA